MTNAEILKAEFKAAVKSRFGTATPENIKKYFLLYDKNKDGAIQRDELYQLLYDINVDGCRSAVFKTCDRWTDGVMDQIDTDKDGKITWEEYRVAAGLPKEAPPPPPPPPSKDGKDGTGLTDIEKGISGSKKPEEPANKVKSVVTTAKEEVAPAAKEEVAPAASVSSSSGGALGAIALAVAGLGALFFFGRK